MAQAHEITTREQALDLLDRYLASRDAALIAPYIRGMSDENAEVVFSIMQGSGNEMSPLTKLLGLLNTRGLINSDDALSYIKRHRHGGERPLARS